MPNRVKRHDVVQPSDSSIRLIPLTLGKNALVDAADYEFLRKWNWYAHYCPRGQCFVARRREGKRGPLLSMHRELLRPPDGIEIDHKNHDTLDNRRCNLRFATGQQNLLNRRAHKDNRSGFKGVCWSSEKGKWKAEIQSQKVRKHIGYFETPEDAARAYDRHATVLHGEFAFLNFPRAI